MSAATTARPGRDNRMLVVDPTSGTWVDRLVGELPDLLRRGDLLVVNDAATLPASLFGVLHGEPVELRLAGPIDQGLAILFGRGSWRQATEDRPAPPLAMAGDAVQTDAGDVPIVDVSPLSPRLVHVRIGLGQLYALGRPVQYSYMQRDLRLDEVQTPYATRPLAVEMPSAGRALGQGLRQRLADAGVGLATLTEAAGLSATGDPVLDAALPLPERYSVPQATWDAVQAAQRVIAVGTSVVRALESAARGPLAGITDLRLGAGTELRVVDGLLSGMHEPGESHFELMAAFADLGFLRAAHEHAQRAGYRSHEFGDNTLLLAA